MSNLSRHKMSNKKETPEEIIINKGEIVYKELEEREGHESTARDIPIESYVYAYLKAIDSAYKYLIDIHLHDKTMGPRLDGLKDRFNLVIEIYGYIIMIRKSKVCLHCSYLPLENRENYRFNLHILYI